MTSSKGRVELSRSRPVRIEKQSETETVEENLLLFSEPEMSGSASALALPVARKSKPEGMAGMLVRSAEVPAKVTESGRKTDKGKKTQPSEKGGKESKGKSRNGKRKEMQESDSSSQEDEEIIDDPEGSSSISDEEIEVNKKKRKSKKIPSFKELKRRFLRKQAYDIKYAAK